MYRNLFETAGDGLIINDLETGRVVEANPAAAAMHGYAREEFIGLLPAAYLHPDSQRPFTADIEAARSGKTVEGLAIHVRRDGSQFHAEVRRTALSYKDRPSILSAIRDVSRRVQAETLLHQRVEAHAREQSMLLEISRTLASALELPPELILEEIAKDQSNIPMRRSLCRKIRTWSSRPCAVRSRLPQAVPIRIRIKDPETLTRLFQRTPADPDRRRDRAPIRRRALCGRCLEMQAGLLLAGVQSWMWVPIAVKSRVIASVGVAHETADFFTAHHATLALTVANQAATTMVNADLYEHARELATLEERQRLAQNLHDAVNQSLFSAGLIAEVLPRLWERDQEEARRSLEDLRRLTRGALAEMRALLAELRPSTLTDAELGDLLRLLGNAFTGRTNIPVAMTLERRRQPAGRTAGGVLPHLPGSVEQYRQTRQCQPGGDRPVAAMRKGWNCTSATTAAGLSTSEPAPSGHYGLGMMRERAEAVKAVLTVASRPGAGTEITLRWREAPKQEAV